jgi:hypothetical protein
MAALQPVYENKIVSAPGIIVLSQPSTPYRFSRVIFASVYCPTILSDPHNTRVIISIYSGVDQIYAISSSFNNDMRAEFNLLEVTHNMPPMLDFQAVPNYELRVITSVACTARFRIQNT